MNFLFSDCVQDDYGGGVGGRRGDWDQTGWLDQKLSAKVNFLFSDGVQDDHGGGVVQGGNGLDTNQVG